MYLLSNGSGQSVCRACACKKVGFRIHGSGILRASLGIGTWIGVRECLSCFLEILMTAMTLIITKRRITSSLAAYSTKSFIRFPISVPSCACTICSFVIWGMRVFRACVGAKSLANPLEVDSRFTCFLEIRDEGPQHSTQHEQWQKIDVFGQKAGGGHVSASKKTCSRVVHLRPMGLASAFWILRQKLRNSSNASCSKDVKKESTWWWVYE